MMSLPRCAADPPPPADDLRGGQPHELGWSPDSKGLIAPRRGVGVCQICFNLIRPGHDRCRACEMRENHLDLLAPISYSVSGTGLHREIAAYKRDAEPFVPHAVGHLTAILARFLAGHELCVGAGERFDLVTTVPSSDRHRDQHHQLRRMVAELVPAVRTRYRRLLVPTGIASTARPFNPDRYRAVEPLSGERVLLIDDMWTTGASAQSAAAVLRDAGARYVAAVVIGRHLNRGYADNEARLSRLGRAFSWARCVLCEPGIQRNHGPTGRAEAATLSGGSLRECPGCGSTS